MILRRRRRERRQPARFAYSRWDGSQAGIDLDVDQVFAELADDLLYHGDLAAALRRMMHEGMVTGTGRRLPGIDEMLRQLRERRRELLESGDLGGSYDDIAEALREIVASERRALDDLLAEARRSGDRQQQDLAEASIGLKAAELDMLPPDLAGQVKHLGNYSFESAGARRRYEELVETLREQFLQQFLNRMASDVSGLSQQDMARTKDMMDELNRMLEQRAAGEEPNFAGFMDRYGDFFPENPRSLDELLEVMARRMAAAQSLLNSMTPSQRAQIQALSDQLLGDMDLRWQFDQLARNLRSQFEHLGWDRGYEFSGTEPLDFSSALDLLGELGEIDQMEHLLRSVASPAAMAEVDTDVARELLGDAAAASLEQMARVARMLEEAGLIEIREGRYEMTPRAIRRIGQAALREVFSRMSAGRLGRHSMHRAGSGHEREFDTKPYEYGDPFNLHIEKTVRNALARSGCGVPVELSPEDFEVERTEHEVRSSTVLMLDISLSMEIRGNFLPAKKVAIALHALISSQYPRDYLGLVSFSEAARSFAASELPEVSWDYVYGTNMQHGFMLARQMLARQSGTKQIIMITDGEPTAHITPAGRPFFSYPTTPETFELTLAEVRNCSRAGIRINTFMLDATSYLIDFVETISKLNGGRVFATTRESLGDYVLIDFVEYKRSLLRSGSRIPRWAG